MPMPRTAGDVVADLHALVTAAHLPGPYLLVAHSLGGMFARLYAHRGPATRPGDRSAPAGRGAAAADR
jgi:alpha-beta hydrolase superfamily lysophospholipase